MHWTSTPYHSEKPALLLGGHSEAWIGALELLVSLTGKHTIVTLVFMKNSQATFLAIDSTAQRSPKIHHHLMRANCVSDPPTGWIIELIVDYMIIVMLVDRTD